MREIEPQDAFHEAFHLCGISPSEQRYGRKSAHNIMAEGAFVMRQGKGYTIKCKSLGAGIYSVWAEERK